MPKRKRSKSKKKKRPLKRPYKLDKKSRARHRARKRRHPSSRVHGHHKRMREEAELSNYLLHQVLKTASSTDADPYSYNPRDHSKDPEYKFSSPQMQEFKRGVPASDTNFWRPQGKGMPPHRGNFPGWEPQWAHTYNHPHAPDHGYPWFYNDPAGQEIYDHLRR